METSLKTGFAQIFSCCPQKTELPKTWGGCSPPRPPGPYAYASKRLLESYRVTIGSIHQSVFLRTKCTLPNYAASCNKNSVLLIMKIAINDENGYFSLKINIQFTCSLSRKAEKQIELVIADIHGR